jgi:glycosyltransferase involved in cell wall biosynthesis
MPQRPRPFDIVHVSSAHPWTDNRVHHRMASAAAGAGYRTALVAVTTDGDVETDWDGPDAVSGVYVRRIPARPRARRLCVSAPQAVRAALSARATVVHLHDPELVWAIPMLRLAGRRVVYDAHEDLPDQVRGKEYLGTVGRWVASVLARVLIRVASRSDAVVAATPDIAERFPAGRTTVVRNVPRLRPADHAAPPTAERPAVAVYLGALAHDRGLDVLVDVAAAPLPAGWRVVTAGRIDPSVDRRGFDASRSAGRIDHRGVLEPDAARDLLLGARVGLLPLLPTPAYLRSIPTKLFEYLAAGLPVIASDVPLWRSLVGDVECVTWVPAGDADAIVRAVRRYDADAGLLAAHARAGQALVADRYRWDRESPLLLDVYATLFGVRPTSLPTRGSAADRAAA